MSAPPEQEILREARRILRLIAPDGAHMTRRHDGRWVVVQRGKPSARGVRVSPELVAAFRARDWLVPLPRGDLVLSELGRNWLAAELAGIDPLAARHQTLGLCAVPPENGEAAIAAINEAESPLAWLRARKGVTDQQYEAGEKLRRDYTLARLEPRVTVDLSAPKVHGRGPLDPGLIPDTVLAAKQRFSEAMRAAGPGLADLLFDVCCALKGVGDIETAKGWPRRSAKIVLALALDRLADHYGLNPRPARGRLRSWSAEFAEAAGG